MPDPALPKEYSTYNPVIDEPEATRDVACIWELLRRNVEFRKDAELWCGTWHRLQELIQASEWQSATERKGTLGKANEAARVECTETLFTIRYGGLPFTTWEPVQADEMPAQRQPGMSEEEIALLRQRRGWQRARYILCALKWMLPATLFEVRPPENDEPHGAIGVPEVYNPELPSAQLTEHQPFGAIKASQAWPETSPLFRREFQIACTPGSPNDKFQKLDFGQFTNRLIELTNKIAPGHTFRPPPTPKELEAIATSINGIALHLLDLGLRYECFLIPGNRVYPAGQLDEIFEKIRAHFETYKEGLYLKGAFLGRDTQWKSYLIAEKLDRVNGHLDHYRTAKIVREAELGDEARNITMSAEAKKFQNDVESHCKAIAHWIGCVYPKFSPKPYPPKDD